MARMSSTDCRAFATVARRRNNVSGCVKLLQVSDMGDELPLGAVNTSCLAFFVSGSSKDLCMTVRVFSTQLRIRLTRRKRLNHWVGQKREASSSATTVVVRHAP